MDGADASALPQGSVAIRGQRRSRDCRRVGPGTWLKDRFGVSWQVVPTVLSEMLQDEDPEKAKRVMAAMLKMKKISVQGLKNAYEGGLVYGTKVP